MKEINEKKEKINNQVKMKGRKEGTNQKECNKYLISSSPLALTQKGEGQWGEKRK